MWERTARETWEGDGRGKEEGRGGKGEWLEKMRSGGKRRERMCNKTIGGEIMREEKQGEKTTKKCE